jgi:hypothetical protein
MQMANKENGDASAVGTKEAVAAYEEAMKEFAISSAEFLSHVELLHKARASYQRAMTFSARLRETLDSGDEILQNLRAEVEQALAFEPGKDASDKKEPEALKVEAIKAGGERANAARM